MSRPSFILTAIALLPTAIFAGAGACTAGVENVFTTSSSSGAGGHGGAGATTSSSSGHGGQGGDIILIDASPSDAPVCGVTCSGDQHTVLDCNGNVLAQCSGDQGCDVASGTCINACQAAVNNKQSVGCEYYATFMDLFNQNVCFAAFVANTWNTPAHINVEYLGASLPLASFARIPQGSGPSLTYAPFDPAAGLAPGEVVILFLSGQQGPAPQCPIPSAVPSGPLQFHQTGIGNSFRITSDVPVVSYQINPYGGGNAAVTGASLLLPTSAWDKNYIAVNAGPPEAGNPSMNIIAYQNGTKVTMVPVSSVSGSSGIPGGPANQPLVFFLDRGQQAQISQPGELTGSVIDADKPIGVMAGHQCLLAPQGVYFCDHAEQMLPPVKALGSEYVGVMHKSRKGEPGIWRLVGAVDNTTLTWSSNVGGPTTLNQGQSVQFITDVPFVVKSQGADHPFMLFSYMSGSQWSVAPGLDGYGDSDFVISVPPQQYMSSYVFFADPTYPETNLVLVRAKKGGVFQDVTLDCAGVVTGWQPVGEYEYTRVDLITGNFQNVGNCSTGRHEIESQGRFGLWVWGWGTPLTSTFTENVSYGYPGGMNVQPINDVVVPPIPK